MFGATPREVLEVTLQSTIYCGMRQPPGDAHADGNPRAPGPHGGDHRDTTLARPLIASANTVVAGRLSV
jgi:hypothetical protein